MDGRKEKKNEQQNNAPNPKKTKQNAAAGYRDPVKIELLKSVGLQARGNGKSVPGFYFWSSGIRVRSFSRTGFHICEQLAHSKWLQNSF